MEDIDEKNDIIDQYDSPESSDGEIHRSIHLRGMYENWFLDYASYVILERAVPDIEDGLKPVHRRILHSMKDLDDGRYNKVANIIGHTMKYHPHGDASIGDAIVHLAQKDLLIDTQGNWGNALTGDSAAAPRYIEARLSKFALEVLFNPKTTDWKSSYDGRNKEPKTLPVKFPLLLSQGVEGIAVGLATKILSHNFNELIDASIDILNEKEIEIFPDFSSYGMADFSKYNYGIRGGKVRIRAKITQIDKKTLVINEIPATTTTTSLIDSVISANDKGKIKIRKIDDNTAQNVEIFIHLAPGVSPDTTIDALYAFTDCEVSISPNSCIIEDGVPKFLDVREILKMSTHRTLSLLKQELEIKRAELYEQLHFYSLEKIFIEERIYRKIEKCETWESVLKAIDTGLKPFKKNLPGKVTQQDIIRLTEIKIKRISRYDSFKADKMIKDVEEEIKRIDHDLDNLIDYAIAYFKAIKRKFGKGRERKTEIRNFDTIQASMVAVANQKLYVNYEEGFAGTSLKKDEYVCDCSDIDDIIVFRSDGSFNVVKVTEKFFVGKGVIHIDVFKKNDERTIYNLIYQDGMRGKSMIKRCAVKGVTRDKDYYLTKGTKGSKLLYFTANPNGEAEVVKVYLRPKPKLRILNFDFDFSTLAIKGRGANGNILSRHSVRKVIKKEEGVSTLGARGIWFDDTIKRLNSEERGQFLGDFKGDDKILTIMQSGYCKLVNYTLSTHFDENMILIKKYDPEEIITAIYFDNTIGKYYAKRFLVDNTEKKQSFIAEDNETRLIHLLPEKAPRIEITLEKKNKEKVKEIVELKNFITVKGYKAKGKRLHNGEIKKIKLLETESTAKNNNTEIIPGVEGSPSGVSLKENVDITKL
ncbi:MAG: DNA gyrase/topoisomerase IV subunit A [Bacteroidales bacterium]|nr:DNA gyrase/topoisomerase IV subunit A [Bacteroidales bacterium]